MSDRLRTGKPLRRGTRHSFLLSLSTPSVGGVAEWVASESWRVKRHVAWYTSPYSWSCSVFWCLAEGIAFGVDEILDQSAAVARKWLKLETKLLYITYRNSRWPWMILNGHFSAYWVFYVIYISKTVIDRVLLATEFFVNLHIDPGT